MAKATITIRQTLNYRSDVQAYFAANQALFNRVASFYFDVIQAHSKILDLSNKEALTTLEKLTHATKINRHASYRSSIGRGRCGKSNGKR